MFVLRVRAVLPNYRLAASLLWLILFSTSGGYRLFAGEPAEEASETPVNQWLSPAGRQIALAGMRPHALALSPDARLLVTSGETHELVLIDPSTTNIIQRVPFPADNPDSTVPKLVSPQILQPDTKAQLSFTGLIFSHDGRRIYLSNINGDIKVFGVDDHHKVSALFSIPLPPANALRRAEEIPAGLALSKDDKRLYVALNLSNKLGEFDAASGKLLRAWEIGVAPYEVVIVSNRIYVSNWGGRRPGTNSLTGPAGRGTLVRVDSIRRIASEGSVSVINLDAPVREVTAEIITGLHASALALSPNGRWLAVANAGSDTISVIDTRNDSIAETIWTRQEPGDPFGAQPNALAFDKSGKKLFACNGTQNAIAVIQFSPEAKRSRLTGLIPVGWFPSAIVFDARHDQVCVANLKGLSPGRMRKPGGVAEHNSMQWHGSISLVAVPSSRVLKQATQTTLANIRYPLLAQANLAARDGIAPAPVPERVGEPSVFKHVIYIIKENRTYDQILGDVREGDGEPSLCTFGERYTPNQHKLVREFVLLDNTYCSGSRSSDGHQWTDSAMATDYMEKSFAGFPRSYPAGGDLLTEDALAYSPAGFIWDHALARGRTVRDYGEFSYAHLAWTGGSHKAHPGFGDTLADFTNGTQDVRIWSEPNIESLRPYLVTNTVGWCLEVPDVFRAARLIEDIRRFDKEGGMPNLSIIWLPNDHTGGTSPGTPTPAAYMADNDLAVGRIVDALSHTSLWKDTCVVAIEDDPQAGWDHVTGYRTTAYVASAYTKRHEVIHTRYNTTSLLRTIELILGLPPMNQMDATATPMFDCFNKVADLTPFSSVANNIPLDQVNPPAKRLSDPLLRRDAYASARLPLRQADQCPEDVLNRILWHAMMGPAAKYPEWAVIAQDED